MTDVVGNERELIDACVYGVYPSWHHLQPDTMPLETLNRGVRLLRALLTDPAYFWRLSAVVILADAVFTQAIVVLVPC